MCVHWMRDTMPDTSTLKFPAPVNDQWDYLLSTIWSQMVHLVIKFGGRLDPERVYRAFTLVLEAQPLLASRFIESSDPYWESIPGLSRDSIFTLLPVDDAEYSLHRTMTTRIDPAKGPQARLALIRGRNDSLVLSVNHAVSDAFGVKHVSRLLCQAYRGLEKDPGFRLPRHLQGDRSFYPFLASFSPEILSAASEACGEQSAVWGIPSTPGVCTSPAYRTRVMEKPRFLNLKKYSHTHNVTINDLLLSAFFAALCPEIPHSPGQQYPVLTSVDLRRSLPHYHAPPLANLSVAFEVPILAQSFVEFPSLVGDVHHTMSEKKRLFAGLGAAMRLQDDFSSGFYSVRERLRDIERRTHQERYPKNPFFSNTGIIAYDSVDFGTTPTVYAFMAPPVDYPPGFGVTASTYEDNLTLASGFCADSVSPILVERILSRMDRHLSMLTG